MNSIPRTKPQEYIRFFLPLAVVLFLFLGLVGLYGAIRGESFFGAIYSFPGTQLVLVLLVVSAAVGVVCLIVGLTRRLRFYRQLPPNPEVSEKESPI